jgi:hypothetical protein
MVQTPSLLVFYLPQEVLPPLDFALVLDALRREAIHHAQVTPALVGFCQHNFRVRFHQDHVGRFLRRRLGWTPQKPERRARSRDENAILDWQSRDFPRSARAAQERGAHLVFLDESGFFLTPSVRRTWAPRGQTPILDAWDRRDRIAAISSISVSPRHRRLNLHLDRFGIAPLLPQQNDL